MTASESITILHARRRRLAKGISGDGSILPADTVKFFDFSVTSIADFAALEVLLLKLAGDRSRGVVRGAPADLERVTDVRRLLHPREGDAATLVEVPRCWLAIDIDGVPRPAWVDVEDLIACGAVAAQLLPAEFAKARLIVQATASHGLKRGLRLRLWAWLSRPVGGAELKAWFRGLPVDAALFSAGQMILTASPAILWGAADPLPTRFAVVSGHQIVSVPPPARLAPSPLPRPTRSARGGNIAGLIRTVAHAPRGRRNVVLYWAACRAAEQDGVDRASASAELIRAARAIGLPLIEAKKTVESAFNGGRP